LIANSGNFLESTPLIWSKSQSPFVAFIRWSDWLYAHTGRNYGIALGTLVELLFEYLVKEIGLEPALVANAIYRDYQRGGRSDKPELLRPYLKEEGIAVRRSKGGLKRQSRHIAEGRTPPALAQENLSRERAENHRAPAAIIASGWKSPQKSA